MTKKSARLVVLLAIMMFCAAIGQEAAARSKSNFHQPRRSRVRPPTGQEDAARSKAVEVSRESVTKKLNSSKLKPGDNLILKQRNGVSIFAVLNDRKITLKALDSHGNVLPVKTKGTSSYTECWYCCGQPPKNACDVNCYNENCK